MSPIDLVLSHLEQPREVAPGRWRARCPGHDGKKRTTLSITQRDDGRVLLHCFAECDAAAVVQAMGLDMGDLFPPKPATPGGGASPMRHPFVPAQVYDVLRFEATVVYLIAADMQADRAVSEGDFDRLGVALGRIYNVAGVYHRGR